MFSHCLPDFSPNPWSHHLYLIGAACISLQYDVMLQRFQSVGIHVAVSSISRGKTNCAKVALAAVGNYPKGYTIYLTDSLARSYLGGALPFVYDDPSSDRVLKPLLMNSFGGAEMGTQRQQFVARCSPIITANEFILDDLAKADKRYSTCMCIEYLPLTLKIVSYLTLYKGTLQELLLFPLHMTCPLLLLMCLMT